LVELPAKRIVKDGRNELLIDLIILLHPAIEQENVTLALAIKNPLEVDEVVDVDKTLIRVLQLLLLL
jgi:hypothetical protein